MNSSGAALFQTLALLMSSLFVGYVLTIMVPYVRRKSRPGGDADHFRWHLFVPARDEQDVIGGTVAYLRETFPAAHLWVIDDDSEDETAQITASLATEDDRIHLVRRFRPCARTGKGDALNAAYDALLEWLAHTSVVRVRSGRRDTVDRAKVIVGVVDADGRPAPGCLDVCAAPHLFDDPRVGGVQIGVRMVNRSERRPLPSRGRLANFRARLLVRMQDLEFQGPISAMQASRRTVGTVAMGGNGQFSRLTALDGLRVGGEGPWRGTLLEDFEIGVHLLLDGWRTEHTEDTWVDQEGLVSFRRFITQRTRWGQGVMQCIKYLPKLWRSNRITHMGALEIAYYLTQPWLNVVGTVVYAVPITALAVAVILDPGGQWSFFIDDGGWTLMVLYVVFGVGSFALWGPLYRHRVEPHAGRLQSFGWGVAYSMYVGTVYITSWRAAYRILRRRNGWSKTRRNADVVTSGPVALER